MQRCWNDLVVKFGTATSSPLFKKPPFTLLSTPTMPLSQAWNSSRKVIPMTKAAGEIAAEMICPYPPGISLLVPGEKLEQQQVDWFLEQHRLWPDNFPKDLMVISGAK